MKNILVCSDLSDRSDHPIRRASRLARRHSSALTICTVVDDDWPPKFVGALKEEAKAELHRTCSSLGHDDAEIVVEVGEPVQTVLSVADRVDADLIVLGTHRHRPFWDMVGGTTMERIVHAGRRPALLVPEPVQAEYSSVLAGVDFSPSGEAALRLAWDFAPDAKFTTFHAVHVPYRGWFDSSKDPERYEPFVTEARQRIDTWWRDRDLPKEIDQPQILPMPLHEAFRKMRHEVKPDLVAIGAHGRSGFTPSLLGSFTETIIRWQFCDVLVVKA